MSHLKRLLAPKFWKVRPKEKKWVVSPRSGPHKKFVSIPLQIVVRDILGIADGLREAKKIIKAKEILVDGKERKDPKYGVGLMDVIHIPKMKKFYRVVMVPSGLKLIEIPQKEANLKLCRINRKFTIKGGKYQLGLHDGRNILVENKAKNKYSTGDSLLIEIPSQKIVEHLKMEKGKIGLITGGTNKGKIVKIKAVKETRSREPNKVVCDLEGRELETVKDDTFVVGEEKPVIKIME